MKERADLSVAEITALADRLSKRWYTVCLVTDPFAGDFGGSDDRTLSDKIVKAAKDHPGACHACAGDIAKGERHRSRSDIADGEMMSFRWCAECCAAQAASWEDNGEAWESRVRLGMQRRNSLL